MSEVSCHIIRDLLPLYHDNVCSEESRRTIEEHLQICIECRKELESIASELEISSEKVVENKNESKIIEDISAFWKRSRVQSFIKGAIISALSLSIIVLGYIGLFEWNIKSVSTDVMNVSNISKLEDGRIAYYFELKDGYALNRIKYDMDEEGNFYLTPLRPIIQKKAESVNSMAMGYDFFNLEGQEMNYDGKKINALYFGTPEDSILLWEKGMDLPKASEEIENMLKIE